MPDEHDVDPTAADDLAALRALGAGLTRDDLDLAAPPDDMWARIEAAAGDPALAPPGDPEAAPGPVVGPSRPTTRRLPGWALAAAAAVLVVVVAAAALVLAGRSDPEVVASTTLDRLGDAGSGRAELLDDDGAYRLRVTTDGLATDDGYFEVWLIDTDVAGMVSLGPLRADGTYDLPPGIDPAAFPVVDVSAEPFDGDPTHSGDSVLRGVLDP